ncbi:MAG: hypothetical protein GF368_06010 [Candidatus Aenigmarchaeota archaeon]|nr:hypothetical protein [Candidatus Aenigmarchaeota archaeon]
MVKIGIYVASTQSGSAFLADLVDQGHDVYGYFRGTSDHAQEVMERIRGQGGVYLERPNEIGLGSRFVDIREDQIGSDPKRLVDDCDMIVFPLPAIYQEESVHRLKDVGLTHKKRPVILAPGRSFPSPYLWRILGEGYPIVSFSTCPYSCKSPEPGRSLIKRRKRNWIGSWEGIFDGEDKKMIMNIWPQVLWTSLPGATTLNNIGAIFHPGPYILAWDEIETERDGENISYYMDLIANRPEVGRTIEGIDQMRLGIAVRIGLKTFGYSENPRENEWERTMEGLRREETLLHDNPNKLRITRASHLGDLSDAVISAQHWLDYTYGVRRKPNEPLHKAIERTPTYQNRSVPQGRYWREDIPVSLLPLVNLAQRLDIPNSDGMRILDDFKEKAGIDPNGMQGARNLEEFDDDYLVRYLKGELCW